MSNSEKRECMEVLLELDPDVLRHLRGEAKRQDTTLEHVIVSRLEQSWENTDPCAVSGCDERGVEHSCPRCRFTHGHGRIHYQDAPPGHGLTLRTGGWWLLCDLHYRVLAASFPRRS